MPSRSCPLALLAALAALPLAPAAPARAQGRLRPPEVVTCDRNRLTSFAGRVTALQRGRDETVLKMDSDADTKETFRLSHAGQDVRSLFFLEGKPFEESDWAVILDGKKPRKGARATVWVCQDEKNPKVDWRRPAEAPASSAAE